MIPLSVPCLKGNEERYVLDALNKTWVSSAGGYVIRFEQELEKYLKVKSCVALQSGTAAIHLALRLAGVERNNEVNVPTLTFIATINPIKYLGAEPVFMDCDDYLTIDCDKLEQFLQQECMQTSKGIKNKSSNRYIKAIIAVHVFGNMANMKRLSELAKQYDLKLIEDATESIGSFYCEGELCNQFSGTMGDFGAFSFNGNKIITTGGGGMLTAKDDKMVQRARYLSTQAKDDDLNYIHNDVGYNYRMTNLQAALGVAQLEQLEAFIKIKNDNYTYYKKKLESMKHVKLLPFQKDVRSNYWFYSLLLSQTNSTKEFFVEELKRYEIQTRPIWKLCHMQKMYQSNQSFYIEKAYFYWERIINIPCSVTLTYGEIDYIADVLSKIT